MIDAILNKNACIRLIYASLWVTFMMFFVYANLVSMIFLDEKNFTVEYLKIQSNIAAIFVNFGMVFMLALDNFYHEYVNNKQFLFLVFCSVFIIIALYGHAQCYFDDSKNYIPLLKTPWVSYLLQGAFIGILLILKCKTTEIIKINIKSVI